MIYCMSDIHGRIDLFEQLLEKINLQDNDKLYILGDTIDRGGGLEVLERCMQSDIKDKIHHILGNHEFLFVAYLLSSGWKTKDVLCKDVDRLIELEKEREKINQQSARIKAKDKPSIFDVFKVYSYVEDMKRILKGKKVITDEIISALKLIPRLTETGAYRTIADLNSMSTEEIQEIVRFIYAMPTKEEINVNGNNYILVHGGYRDDITTINQLFAREDFYQEKTGLTDTTVVFGHTTTRDINIITTQSLDIPFKIWFDKINNDKIGIDCGAAYPHGQLACLRLDDMQQFYVKNDSKIIVPVSFINSKFENLANVYNTYLQDFRQNPNLSKELREACEKELEYYNLK